MNDDARRLLNALRRAGCHAFIEEGQFFCSPPSRRVDWPDGDVEEALDEYHDELLFLLMATTETVH